MNARPQSLGSYFSAKVRGKRHEIGIRQVDLARLANVSVDTIVVIESGAWDGLDIAANVAQALGIELSELMPTTAARAGRCERCLDGIGQHSKWCAEQTIERKREKLVENR